MKYILVKISLPDIVTTDTHVLIHDHFVSMESSPHNGTCTHPSQGVYLCV